MWIYTQHGFISITRDPKHPDRYQVRARRRPDVERIAALLDPAPEIVDTPGGDYACRFFLDPEPMGTFMKALGDDVDYTNYKSRAHRTIPDAGDVLWKVYAATEQLRG